MIFNNVLGKKAAKLQSKSVTYTSNGTASVTPGSGYDGLSGVDVTVNVSASTAVEKCTIVLTHNGYGSGTVTYVYRKVIGANTYNMSGTLAKNETITLSNVACNSLFVTVGNSPDDYIEVSTNITDDNGELCCGENGAVLYAITPGTANATGTITVTCE